MTRLRYLTLERALLLLLALSIASCNSFASINVAYAPHPSSRLYLAPPSLEPHGNNHKYNPEQYNGKNENNNKKLDKRQEYQKRKQEWLDRYGSVDALQRTFGSTKGDLSPEQTRRLYHTLLPRSLLGLYEMGLMKPEELAPLAYEARIAAKQYARKRCVWYARIATQLFDQYRNLRDKGKLRSGHTSPTWDEIWSKYEAQIVQEECAKALQDNEDFKPLKEKDLTMRIYLRILEKSTATNKAFDKLFLKNNVTNSENSTTNTRNSNLDEETKQLQQMGQQLDEDVRNILLGPKDSAKALKKSTKLEAKQEKERLKQEERERKRLEKLAKKQQKELEKQQKSVREHMEKEQKRLEKEQSEQRKDREKKLKEAFKTRKEEEQEESEELTEDGQDSEEKETKEEEAPKVMEASSQSRWQILKIMAGTRSKFRVLRDSGKLENNDYE